MTMFFGESWSPMTEQGQQIPVPVGSKCCHCEEGFVEGDQGVSLPKSSMSEFDVDRVISSYYHKNCFLRIVFGSVGHQRRQCKCYGGTLEDPQELSPREAANAAVREYEVRSRRSP